MKAHADKPTIVHIAGYYPPHLGGMERVAQALAETLADDGYDVRVLTSTTAMPTAGDPVTKGLRITRLKTFEFAHTPFMPGFLWALTRLPKRSILHVHLAQAFYPDLALIVAKLRRQPYVLHFHLDLQPSGFFGSLFIIYKAVVIRFIVRCADHVIVFSDEQKAFINQTYGVPKGKITSIPNGVGEEYFVTRPRGYHNQTYNLLTVGRLSPQKRMHILVEAMAHLRTKAVLRIVGDGEDRFSLEALVKKLELTNVRFEGQRSAVEVIPYLRQADLYVSSSENEGMPLAVLEAMAAGLPIVATNVPGLAELVSGIGVLVDDATGRNFARTLDGVLENPEKLHDLSKRSLAAARTYSWRRGTDRVETLYRELRP